MMPAVVMSMVTALLWQLPLALLVFARRWACFSFRFLACLEAWREGASWQASGQRLCLFHRVWIHMT